MGVIGVFLIILAVYYLHIDGRGKTPEHVKQQHSHFRNRLHHSVRQHHLRSRLHNPFKKFWG